MAVQKTQKELEMEINLMKKELEETRTKHEEQKRKNKQEKEKAEKYENLLQSVVTAAAGKIGQDFFDNIIISLSEWLGAECVLIGKMVEGERIEAVPLLLDGKISHGFSYDLAGSPCDITTRKGYCTYSENVIDLFPKDQILVDLNAESYIGSALYNKNGETNGVICAVSRKKLDIPPYAHDILKIIGARVTAEIERQKVEENLRESNNAKDKFFSIISHDLQNPLNILTGFSEILIKNSTKYDPKTQHEFIKHIYNAAKNMNNLVSDLLAWSLSNGGVIECHMEKVDLYQKINKTITLVKTMADRKSTVLRSSIEPNTFVNGDKNMLATIFRNLISNAIKFTNPGGEINVYTKNVDEDPRKIKIVVEDNGIGIKENRIQELFRIDVDTSTKGTKEESGTGLGLVLCKDFVEKQNGRIWIESEVGKGSKFIFTLDKF